MINLHQVYVYYSCMEPVMYWGRVHPVPDVLSCAFFVIEETTNEVCYGNKTMVENTTPWDRGEKCCFWISQCLGEMPLLHRVTYCYPGTSACTALCLFCCFISSWEVELKSLGVPSTGVCEVPWGGFCCEAAEVKQLLKQERVLASFVFSGLGGLLISPFSFECCQCSDWQHALVFSPPAGHC